jgi:hypothetical protein
LDEWIYYTSHIHTTRDYRRYNATADLHTLQVTVSHPLGFSVFTSRILATDLQVSLSLQITHEVFFAQPNSFLASILPTANSEDWTQFNSSAPKPISWQTGISKLDSVLYYSTKFFFITTLHGPHGKYRLLLSRIVLGMFEV